MARFLPVFDGLYRVDQHEDVEQEAVPDPHDQHCFRQHEHRERAAEPELSSEHEPEPAGEDVTERVYDRVSVVAVRHGPFTVSVAPANAHELSVVPELTERTCGVLVGDRNYHSPKTREELATMGIELLAPYSSKKRDPAPRRSALLSRFRYRIDTVFSQLTQRYSIKRVWARDLWHLMSRLVRKVLSHTVAFLLNHKMGNQPLQLSKLLVR